MSSGKQRRKVKRAAQRAVAKALAETGEGSQRIASVSTPIAKDIINKSQDIQDNDHQSDSKGQSPKVSWNEIRKTFGIGDIISFVAILWGVTANGFFNLISIFIGKN